MIRTALITGGSGTLGRAAGLGLSASGWQLAVCGCAHPAAAEEAAAAVRSSGGRAVAFCSDVSDAGQAQELVAKVSADLGRVDALIHAAGRYERVDVLDETPQHWRGTFAVHLDALLYLSQAVAPGMQAAGWGRIIAFSMAGADAARARPNVAAHYVAKTGVNALIRALAGRLAPDGITCNVIAPGFVDNGKTPTPEDAQAIRRIPAGRTGTPQEVAALVSFLLSDAAAYITGAVIPVSGGWG